MAVSYVSRRVQNDQRSSCFQSVSKHNSPVLTNASHPMVVPVRPTSSSPARILNNILNMGSQPYLKISSYPMGFRGPHCGHIFAAAQSCQAAAAEKKCNSVSNSPSPVSLCFTRPQPAKCAPTCSSDQTPSNSPTLWHRDFRCASLNLKEIRSHMDNAVFRTQSNHEHTRTAYSCPLSPFVVRTLAFPADITDCTKETSQEWQCPVGVSHSHQLLENTTSKASGCDLRFLETDNESSASHSKHSTTQCLATELSARNDIHAGTDTAHSHIECKSIASSSCSRDTSEEGESLCGGYDSQEGESDDEIIFSDESEGSEQADDSVPYIPCRTKAPSRHLMTLKSEESGFGENSFTESNSDFEWEGESGTEGSFCNSDDETWKQFEEQALSFSPALSPVGCAVSIPLDSACPLPHTPLCSQQGAPTADSQPLKQLLQRLHKSRVRAERHQNCCSPKSCYHRDCGSTLASSSVSCPKKVSFAHDSELVQVHHIVVWNYAYRSCRKGPWEQYARDRGHFQSRIDRVSSVIEPCLQKKLQRMSTHSNK